MPKIEINGGVDWFKFILECKCGMNVPLWTIHFGIGQSQAQKDKVYIEITGRCVKCGAMVTNLMLASEISEKCLNAQKEDREFFTG